MKITLYHTFTILDNKIHNTRHLECYLIRLRYFRKYFSNIRVPGTELCSRLEPWWNNQQNHFVAKFYEICVEKLQHCFKTSTDFRVPVHDLQHCNSTSMVNSISTSIDHHVLLKGYRSDNSNCVGYRHNSVDRLDGIFNVGVFRIYRIHICHYTNNRYNKI